MTQLDFVTVDVFTSTPYEGNPLAIVRIPKGVSVSQEQKQAIAREFNLSESTFLHENEGEESRAWTVDIFMTSQELPFAGHPTIGTACYVLSREAERHQIESGVIEANFTLKAGPVGLLYDVVKRSARASIPHDVHIHSKRWSRDEVFRVQPKLASLHEQAKVRVASDFPIVSVVKGMTFALIELESLDALEAVGVAGETLQIDGLDKAWAARGFVGTYYFVRTGQRTDDTELILTRMIEGPLEDPATGSAASDLASYLSLEEGKPNQVLKYKMVQGVEMGRRSEILVDVEIGANKLISKVYLGGGAVQIMEGRLTV